MRKQHVVLSNDYEGSEWEGKLTDWAGISADWLGDGIYVRTQSGFGGSQAFFKTEQIDELISLFQDIKARIVEASDPVR